MLELEGEHPIVVTTAVGGVAIIWRFPIAATAPDGTTHTVHIRGGVPTLSGTNSPVPADWKLVYSDTATEVEKYKGISRGEYVSHREMPKSAVPKDRTFREAWCDVTPAAVVDIDMAKARGIHMGRIRQVRDAKLRDLDIPYMRAMGRKQTAEAERIEAEKERLRDLPQTFDLTAAKDADALKALWPVI